MRNAMLIPAISALLFGVMATSSYADSKDNQIKRVIQSEIQRIKRNAKTMQWSFETGKRSRSVQSGVVYQLLNLQRRRGISRQKRKWSKAANLGFSGGRNITVKKNGGGVIRYGDVVALHLKNYGWLKYQKRGRGGGINLGAPKKGSIYAWRLTGGKRGDIIKTGHPFSLKNLTNRSNYVKYCKRSFGIDLGWGGQKCGGVFAWASNKIWGENGSPNLRGRFCRVAATSGRVYATAKTLGMSEGALNKQINWAIKRCK